jgi:putative membrane protein
VKRRHFWTAAVLITLAAQPLAAQTPIPPAATDFANGAAQSDQYEILAGRVALAQSKNSQVRAYAQHMIEDHTRTSDEVRKASTASGVAPPPPAMSTDQAAMLGALQSLRGADFDKAYIKQQMLAHHQALAVQQSYAESGTDKNLRSVAQSAVPMIQHHLKMAEDIRVSLGGS